MGTALWRRACSGACGICGWRFGIKTWRRKTQEKRGQFQSVSQPHSNNRRSSERNWIASDTSLPPMSCLPARSAMARAKSSSAQWAFLIECARSIQRAMLAFSLEMGGYFHENNFRSNERYWIASRMCCEWIVSVPSRSAMVRATLRMRSCARAEKFIDSIACSR